MWSRELPTEPGPYWYWGFGREKSLHPYMSFVMAVELSDGEIVYVCNGLIRQPDYFFGLWTPADVPDEPVDEFLEMMEDFLERRPD